MLCLTMIVSMGWVYVCELRPPACLFFIPQVYEYGELWWNNIDRLKLLIRPPELCQSYQHLGAGRMKGRKEWWIWTCEVLSFLYLQVIFTCGKILWQCPPALFLLRRKACCVFLLTWKVNCPRPSLNPRTLGPVANTLNTRSPRVTLRYNSEDQHRPMIMYFSPFSGTSFSLG
jgi:hypothetical protein